MPKRPRSHQLETESTRAFVASLPSAWIYRSVNPDYGLDGLVEIFTPSGRSTGDLFFVQLKGTDESRSQTPPPVRLRMHTYQYYQTLLLPVLLVLFQASSRRLYAKWLPDVSSRDSIILSRKHAVINFNSGDSWNSTRLPALRRRVRQLRRATLLAERETRIRRYYALKARIKPWTKSRGSMKPSARFVDGDRILHPVFGRGVVEDATQDYMFVQFDDDDMVRKFIPGDFPDFTIVANRPAHWRRPNQGFGKD
jgi:hypothetical protein